VFEPLDNRGDIVLPPLEIDNPVAPLVTTATPAHRDAAGVVAPGLFLQALGQCLDGLPLPQFAAIDGDMVPLRRGRRVVCLERHSLNPRRHVDTRAFSQRDDRLLEIGAAAGLAADALCLAFDADRVDGVDLDVEQTLD